MVVMIIFMTIFIALIKMFMVCCYDFYHIIEADMKLVNFEMVGMFVFLDDKQAYKPNL